MQDAFFSTTSTLIFKVKLKPLVDLHKPDRNDATELNYDKAIVKRIQFATFDFDVIDCA